MWSPQAEGKSSFNSWLNNPFQYEGSKEFRGSYFPMVEVLGICRDSETLSGVEHMLQKFRSLVSRLEEVDPRKLKHGEASFLDQCTQCTSDACLLGLWNTTRNIEEDLFSSQGSTT